MSDPTREEIDTKLALVEARLDTRIASLDGKIDRMVDAQIRLAGDVKSWRDGLEGQIGEIRGDLRSSRNYVIGAALTLAGLIIGFFAFGVQMLELASAIFSAGGAQ